jgi:hypothetical protein
MYRENSKHLQAPLFSSLDRLSRQQADRLEQGWAGVFYREFFARLDERPFAVLYAPVNSRPNTPVNVLVALEALKAGFNWSDEELQDAFSFDLQVRFALGYRNLGEGEFDLRTVYNFRRRLNAHQRKTGENLIARSFEQVTDAQLSVLPIKTGKLRMDSTQIASNIALMSRLHLLVEIVQRVQRMLSEADHARYADVFAPYGQGSSGQFVYRVRSAEGAEQMGRLGEVMRHLLAELAPAYHDEPGYQLLGRVFTEHFVSEDQRLRLKVGPELSAASLQSPDDPEATFRNKNDRAYWGYVANITETCDPTNPLQLIAKVQTEPNTTNDDDLLIAAIPSLSERMSLEEMTTDGGYNSEESAQVLEAQKITHVQTALRGHASHKRLGLHEFVFTLSEEGHPVQITCPHHQTVAVTRSKKAQTTSRYRAHFASTDCAGCPLAARCLAKPMTSEPLRWLTFDHHDLMIALRRQRLARDRLAGRNLRVAIESTIASLKRPYNSGQLPVRGRFRISMLLIGCASLINVRRIHRYLTDRRVDEAQTDPSLITHQLRLTAAALGLRHLGHIFGV